MVPKLLNILHSVPYCCSTAVDRVAHADMHAVYGKAIAAWTAWTVQCH